MVSSVRFFTARTRNGRRTRVGTPLFPAPASCVLVIFVLHACLLSAPTHGSVPIIVQTPAETTIVNYMICLLCVRDWAKTDSRLVRLC